MNMEQEFDTRAQAMAEDLTAWRRQLHRHPELSFDLPMTRAFVTQKLKEFGLDPQPVGRGGITCTVGQGGPVFLLRGDMDALPMREETGLPFASDNGCMHACGHDFHTTALLGAARLLKEREGELRGTVKLLFQPAEETMDGAQDVYDAGILENPHVDAAMALHVVQAPLGTVNYTPGHACGSSDVFTVTVHGKGGHGSRPNQLVDPFNIACHIFQGAQNLIARELDPNDQAVITFGAMNGGTAANIVPDDVRMLGTLRTVDEGTVLGEPVQIYADNGEKVTVTGEGYTASEHEGKTVWTKPSPEAVRSRFERRP